MALDYTASSSSRLPIGGVPEPSGRGADEGKKRDYSNLRPETALLCDNRYQLRFRHEDMYEAGDTFVKACVKLVTAVLTVGRSQE